MIAKFLIHLVKMFRSSYRRTLNVDQLILNGVKVNLSHPNISPALRHVFYNESYENAELEILNECLDQDDVVMEIGAGIGFISTYCAQRLGSDCVFAYEANPMMIDKIRETYALNGVNPNISNTLLSNTVSSVDFYLEKDFWSSSSIERSENAVAVRVKTADINDEILAVNPSILIVDIEGGEQSLIPMIDFHNIVTLLIEIHPHVIGARAASLVINQIIESGFNLNLTKSNGIVCLFEKT